MGEWKTDFEGEVEGRPVMGKVYESEDDQDGFALLKWRAVWYLSSEPSQTEPD